MEDVTGDASTADEPVVRIQPRRLTAFCRELLSAAGLSEQDAALVAESLVDADCRGIQSHGTVRLRIYVERLGTGLINPTGKPTVAQANGPTLMVDADNSIGVVGAATALTVAERHADSHGTAVVGVRHSNHCGALGFLTRRVAARGWVTTAVSNAPITMAYYGGRTRAVGTNPLSIALPRRDADPIVLDIATSATARGKIIVAAAEDEEIPEGWAVDPDGNPTTDPDAALAGAVLPFGGPKGSGLAMMIDMLCGALVGGPTGRHIGSMYEDWDRPQHVSHLFSVLNPGLWIGREAFLDAVEGFVDEIRHLPPAKGHERVLLPGELEDRALDEAHRYGVQLSARTLDDLHALAREMGVEQANLTQ